MCVGPAEVLMPVDILNILLEAEVQIRFSLLNGELFGMRWVRTLKAYEEDDLELHKIKMGRLAFKGDLGMCTSILPYVADLGNVFLQLPFCDYLD